MFKIFAAILMTVSIFLPQQVAAQAPEKMSYQAVVRNSSDELVKNTQVGMRIRIWKGSANNLVVYSETQTSTTNTNGLMSIEIGAGTVISGSFATIDWGSDIYFIEVGIDPTGGTNYSITTTSQLLSVPYALYAKTAETITGEIIETDPTVKKYSIGDFAQGGIVFWVDETGQHGLVCAKKDQDGGSGIQWYNGTYVGAGTRGDGIYDGEMSTIFILLKQGINLISYAAGLCVAYKVTESGVEYGDWYLPSRAELNLMHKNSDIIDSTAIANGGSGFSNAYYWSATEYMYDPQTYAWGQNVMNGISERMDKKDSCRVRAIRAF